MVRYFVLLFLAAFSFVFVDLHLAYAQRNEPGYNGPDILGDTRRRNMTEGYRDLIKGLYERDEDSRKIMSSLRIYYPYTPQYSAFPDVLEDRLMELSYLAANEKDPEKARLALQDYRNFVNAHLGNMDVLFWAVSLSKQDVRFGNPVFLQEIYDSYVHAIFDNRDGRSYQQRYAIYTFGEEMIILGHIGDKSVGKEMYEYGDSKLHVHDMVDGKTGRHYKLYIDVTAPLKRSVEDYEDSNKDLSKFQ